MIGDKVKSVIDALGPLANKLGQGAEQVFGIYVQHAYAVGWAQVISGIVLILIGVLAPVFIGKNGKRISDNDLEAPAAMLVFILLLGFVGGLILVPVGIMHLMSPQYYALQELIQSVMGAK